MDKLNPAVSIQDRIIKFFVEKLVHFGKPRTFHDLSCHFGSDGFTREMKDAVGGNLAGLTEFLSSQPDYFVINGDFVSLKYNIANEYEKIRKEKSPPPDTERYENWKRKTLQNTFVIQEIGECARFVDRIMSVETRTGKSATVAVDCEGVHLGPNGEITLIQIATEEGKAYIFDILLCPEMIFRGGLKRLLEGNVLKIIHDCRNDSVNLYNQFGIILTNVFDTQVAHSVLRQQIENIPAHQGEAISLNSLCQIYGTLSNPVKDKVKNVYKKNYRYWADRPLSEEMILYSASDVLSLIEPALYSTLSGGISTEFLPLFKDLCDENIFANITVDDVRNSRRERKFDSLARELEDKFDREGREAKLNDREIDIMRRVLSSKRHNSHDRSRHFKNRGNEWRRRADLNRPKVEHRINHRRWHSNYQSGYHSRPGSSRPYHRKF